jgi:hypothetical protein
MKFLLGTLALTGLLMLLGYFPTVSLAGRQAVSDMAMACSLTLGASWIGAIPIFWARRRGNPVAPGPMLASMLIRLLLVGSLALTLALTGWVDRAPFLLWVGISYMAMLVADTALAVGANRRALT